MYKFVYSSKAVKIFLMLNKDLHARDFLSQWTSDNYRRRQWTSSYAAVNTERVWHTNFVQFGLYYNPLLFAIYKMKAGLTVLIYPLETRTNPWILIKTDNTGPYQHFAQNVIYVLAGPTFSRRSLWALQIFSPNSFLQNSWYVTQNLALITILSYNLYWKYFSAWHIRYIKYRKNILYAVK
jgi:hypothetical protein